MGALEHGAHVSATNQFQARYAVRHPWTGSIACDHPVRDRWGAPPKSGPVVPIVAHPIATKTGPEALGLFELDAAVTPVASSAPSLDVTPTAPKAAPSGCNASGTDGGAIWAPIVAGIMQRRRRKIVSRSDA